VTPATSDLRVSRETPVIPELSDLRELRERSVLRDRKETPET
jgi:hypothetical protein